MIYSSLYRLFFILSSLVPFTTELQLQSVEISGGRSVDVGEEFPLDDHVFIGHVQAHI
jgi:hypothetical protein